MPGMLIPSSTSADLVTFSPSETISATSVQAGMQEINTDAAATYATIAEVAGAGFSPILLAGL